jgi:hypothetical protein
MKKTPFNSETSLKPKKVLNERWVLHNNLLFPHACFGVAESENKGELSENYGVTRSMRREA